jgi:predicted dithiol-disulfide oxidoreductase (DUF899 family)
MSPRVVSTAEWLAARKDLLAAEEEAARALQEIASRRREMPAVAIEKYYVFEGPHGKVSLLDLFEGRTQLIVQHFMFDPAWDEGCPVCSLLADNVGPLAHLHARNTSFAAISRAPLIKIEPFRQRMGWTFPWYSSYESDFNYDFHVTHDESEQGGVSVFIRDGDTVLHTWSGYGASTDVLSATDMRLDLTPLGRQDETVELRHHDKYAEDAR